MFKIDEKHFMPCGDTPDYPHSEKPRYTMTEEIEHTAREMRNTIERLLKFEKRLEGKFEDLMKHLTSDNVLFKNTFAEAYNAFLMEAKNEVNTFEGNINASLALFQSTIESDYATLSEDCRTQITEYYNQFVEKLNEYKTELNTSYDAFRDYVESRLEEHNTACIASFNSYTANMNTRVAEAERNLNQQYADFVNQVTTAVSGYQTAMTAMIDEQESENNDLMYQLKSNFRTTLEQMIADGTLQTVSPTDFYNLEMQVDGSVSVTRFGAVGDGKIDDTIAINNALKSGYKNIYFPNGVYLLDPDSFTANAGYSQKIGLQIPSGVTINGCGSTIKLKTTTLETGVIMLATENYKSVSYDQGIADVENITIKDLFIDGSEENLVNTKSTTGIAIYKGKNVIVENIRMENLSGDDGSGYGIIFAYSDNCRFENSMINRSSRSNIYCWESTNVKCENLILNGSLYRDCVTCGSEIPLNYQPTTIHFNNCHFEHLYNTGTHTVRFTGAVTGIVENSTIIGNPNIDGVSIPRSDGGTTYVTIRNCKISNCTVGVNATGHNDYTNITVENCDILANKSIHVEDAERLVLKGNIFDSVDNTSYISFDVDRATIEDNEFSNNTHILVNVAEYAVISRNIIENMSGENAIVLNDSGYVMFTENIATDQNYKARIICSGKAANNRMNIDSTTVA